MTYLFCSELQRNRDSLIARPCPFLLQGLPRFLDALYFIPEQQPAISFVFGLQCRQAPTSCHEYASHELVACEGPWDPAGPQGLDEQLLGDAMVAVGIAVGNYESLVWVVC